MMSKKVTKIGLFAALLASGAWLWAGPEEAALEGGDGTGVAGVLESNRGKVFEPAEPFHAALSARKDSLSPPYVIIELEGREVEIKLAKDEQERWKALCTYVLDDGQVVYSYCSGLEHTPYQGQEKWRVKEARPGLLYIERFRDTLSYLPNPYRSRVAIRKAPIPYCLNYYSLGYKSLLRSVNLYEDNPYTKAKMPQIEIEQCYDAELGYGHSEGEKAATYLWTYSWVIFFDNGYTGLAYSLGNYTSNRGLIGFTRTLAVLDESGQEIFRLNGINEDISPSMVTNDGKFFVAVINKDSDRELGFKGVRIYDIGTGEVLYEDNYGYYEGCVQWSSALVYYAKRAQLYDDSSTTYVFLNLNERIKYEGTFTKDEILSGAISWSQEWDEIIKANRFHATKF